MSEQQLKILNLLSEGKISSEEADRLLNALNSNPGGPSQTSHSGGKPKNLIVQVNGHNGLSKHENVNIKIPIMLIKAGIKVGSFLPKDAKDKFTQHVFDKGLNIDLNKIDSSNIEEFVEALKENPIEIDADNESVRIYCE